MDEIFDGIEERTAGTSGKAVVDSKTVQVITDFSDGTLNKYNALTNVSAIQVDPQIANAVAEFLTVAVERDMNERFHNSLNILEKNGLISEEKFESHKNNIAKKKQLTSIGVYAAFSLAPVIGAMLNNYFNKNEIIDFVVGSYAYINCELTPLIEHNISDLLAQMDITVKSKKIHSVFDKYCNDKGISHIPTFSGRNRNIFGDSGKEILGKEIISRCDLHDKKINNRAMEFIEDFLHIDYLKAHDLLSDSRCSQDSLSDITWFSAISYRYIFLDFIKDVENAKQFATYDISNDPYASIREERKQKMQSIIDDVSVKKGLFLTNGKRKDIIEASAKMMQYSLNPSYDIAMDIKMIKRKKKVLELYGM